MNRRKFLGLLAALPAVAAAAKYLKPEPAPKLTLNPEWVNAPYEVDFWCSPKSHERLSFNPQLYHGELQWIYCVDKFPLRYNAAGQLLDTFVRA